jgi:hypothetical protein
VLPAQQQQVSAALFRSPNSGHMLACESLHVPAVTALLIAGMYMFGHFSLSHTFMPVVDEHDHVSWVRFAMEHSVDVSPGNPVVDWIMVGESTCKQLSKGNPCQISWQMCRQPAQVVQQEDCWCSKCSNMRRSNIIYILLLSPM